MCSQICEPTDDSYVCKCRDGFKLAEDRKTCAKEEDDDDGESSTEKSNEVPTNATEYGHFSFSPIQSNENFKFEILCRDCPSGHTKNEQTGQCDDIDECEGTDVSCNLDTQVCYNVPGSYKCLDVISASTCPNGFKLDPKIKQCIGIFERKNSFVNFKQAREIRLNSKPNKSLL